MYSAKAAGKARLVVFQPHMQEQLHERLRLEQDIDLATGAATNSSWSSSPSST